jgi:hypothetical protein
MRETAVFPHYAHLYLRQCHEQAGSNDYCRKKGNGKVIVG